MHISSSLQAWVFYLRVRIILFAGQAHVGHQSLFLRGSTSIRRQFSPVKSQKPHCYFPHCSPSYECYKRSTVVQKRLNLIPLPFSENISSSHQHGQKTEDAKDHRHMALSTFLLLTELSLVTCQTLTASDFTFCDAVALIVAALAITGCRVFFNWNNIILLGRGRGGRLWWPAIAGLGPKRGRVWLWT